MPEQSFKSSKVYQRRNIIFAVAIIVIVAIYYFFNNAGTPVLIQFDENSMTWVHPTDSSISMEIMYQDILSIDEASDVDVGQMVSGSKDDQFWFGIWENEKYGQYTLCASPQSSRYIVLNTVNGIVVFNYGDSATTQELYKALTELLKKENISG